MSDIPIHLIGMTEDEANAALDVHGYLKHCTLDKDCDKLSSVQLMFKKPGSAPGQDIKSVSACTDHEDELHQMIARVTTTAQA